MIAFVIGGAVNVWSDLERALALGFPPDAYFVINSLIPIWPFRLDYAITLHNEHIEEWKRQRQVSSAHYNMNFETWGYRPGRGIDRTTDDWAGSGGLFAVKIAIQEGFSHIVLCGVPMDPDGKHVVRQVTWVDASMFQQKWRRHEKHINGCTRSMSGWTLDLLGKPTPEWLSKGVGMLGTGPTWPS